MRQTSAWRLGADKTESNIVRKHARKHEAPPRRLKRVPSRFKRFSFVYVGVSNVSGGLYKKFLMKFVLSVTSLLLFS